MLECSVEHSSPFSPLRSSNNLMGSSLSADNDGCGPVRCGTWAQCVSEGENATCQCLKGFTGDGKLCSGKSKGQYT